MRQALFNMVHRRISAAAVMALALTWLIVPGQAQGQANNGEFAGLCAAAADQRERQSGIPKHLLRAIATVETGRWDESSRASFT